MNAPQQSSREEFFSSLAESLQNGFGEDFGENGNRFILHSADSISPPDAKELLIKTLAKSGKNDQSILLSAQCTIEEESPDDAILQENLCRVDWDSAANQNLVLSHFYGTLVWSPLDTATARFCFIDEVQEVMCTTCPLALVSCWFSHQKTTYEMMWVGAWKSALPLSKIILKRFLENPEEFIKTHTK